MNEVRVCRGVILEVEKFTTNGGHVAIELEDGNWIYGRPERILPAMRKCLGDDESRWIGSDVIWWPGHSTNDVVEGMIRTEDWDFSSFVGPLPAVGVETEVLDRGD